MIEDLKQYKNLEFYELKSDTKVIPEEERNYIYKNNYIYRVIHADDEIYLLVFKNEIQKY